MLVPMTPFVCRIATTALAAMFTLHAAACLLDTVGEPSPVNTSSGGGGRSTGGDDSAGGATSTAGGNSSVGGSSTGGENSNGGGVSSGGGSGAGGETLVPGIVNLGMAASYAVLTKTGITNVPPSALTGHLAVSPGPLSYITGFTMTPDGTNQFSTSPEVTGNIYASNHAVPTPSDLTTAVLDMQAAFSEAAARTPDEIELGAGNIAGMTLQPGVYSWSSGLLIPTSVTLTGDATDVWVFQIAQDITVSSDVTVFLTGGALPQHVFWQVSGKLVLGTGSHFEGIVLSQTSVELATGASVNGRLLAQTAVTLDSNTIVEPVP